MVNKRLVLSIFVVVLMVAGALFIAATTRITSDGDGTGFDQINFTSRGDYHPLIYGITGYPSIMLQAYNNQSRPGILFKDYNGTSVAVLEVHDKNGGDSHKHLTIYTTDSLGSLQGRFHIPYGVDYAQSDFKGQLVIDGNSRNPFYAYSTTSNFVYVGNQSWYKGTFYVYRDYNSTVTNSSMVRMIQQNDHDDQPTITATGYGTGDTLRLKAYNATNALNVTQGNIEMANNYKYTFNGGTTVFIIFNSTRNGGSLCLQHTDKYLCVNSTSVYSS